MIKLYKKSLYEDEIVEILMEDKEGSRNIWEFGVFNEDDYNYWEYKIVYLEYWKVAWFCFINSNSLNMFATIKEIYIKPEFRNKWIGKKLLDNWIEYYKWLWFDIFKLTVREENETAIKFYKKYWFIETWSDSHLFRIKGKFKKWLFMTKLN
jgi:ribosomal protein S18 acetylase RimI-like enzyme